MRRARRGDGAVPPRRAPVGRRPRGAGRPARRGQRAGAPGARGRRVDRRRAGRGTDGPGRDPPGDAATKGPAMTTPQTPEQTERDEQLAELDRQIEALDAICETYSEVFGGLIGGVGRLTAVEDAWNAASDALR